MLSRTVVKNRYSIELFSGLGSVSVICASFGLKAISVDIDNKLNPSICCDILNLNLDCLPKNPFFLWASPDCTLFSRANHSQDWYKNTIKYREYSYVPLSSKAQHSLNLVHRTFDIIDFLYPKFWVIENPVGRFRHLDIVRKKVPFRYSVNYKDWGFSYSKETDLFCNFLLPFSKSVPLRVGRSVANIHGAKLRSSVPDCLINFILNYINA